MGYIVPPPPPLSLLPWGVKAVAVTLQAVSRCAYCGNGIEGTIGHCEGCGAPKARSVSDNRESIEGATGLIGINGELFETNGRAPTNNPGTR